MPSVQGRSMLYGFFALNVIDRSLDRTIFQYHNQSGPAASPRRLGAREPTFDTSRRWAFLWHEFVKSCRHSRTKNMRCRNA